uniref:Uncharacterized protein n=1 Tax=Acrobeloides nanus TaxID=290746 RepID=A0A914D0R9_9BILA
MSTLTERRMRFERQMALRTSSNGSDADGFVRQSHLAPPVVAPDSPRPQKAATATGFKSHVLNPTEGFKRDDRV